MLDTELPGIPNPDPRETLWKCLDHRTQEFHYEKYQPEATKFWGPRNTNDDLIGLSNVSGIEIYEEASITKYSSQDLDKDGITHWLMQSDAHHLQSRTRAHTRILLGYQVMQNDGLRVFEDLGQTQISRLQLSKSLRIPESIIDKMGPQESVYTALPQRPSSSQLSSYGVAGFSTSVAWSFDIDNATTTALIVIRRSGRADRLLDLLTTLKDFSRHPGYIPYILIDVEICHWSEALAHCERGTAADSLNIQRFLQGRFKELNELFGHATMRTVDLDSIPTYALPVLETATQTRLRASSVPQIFNDTERNTYELNQKALVDALQYREHELQNLITRSENLRYRTTTMLSTIMGLMSFNQQTSTAEIAQATKEDGTSMRTLSILAAIYLPATTVSAIMAIPVFDWSAPNSSQIVSSRIWVFLVVTIPLTCITMGVFWYWIRIQNSNSFTKPRRSASRKREPGTIV